MSNTKTEHAELLNTLDAMAGNPMYALRKNVLRQAEQLIVSQEALVNRAAEISALLAAQSVVFEQRVKELEAALQQAQKMCAEALPKFNWGASALDANAIRLLNETPLAIKAALAVKAAPEPT